MEHSTNTAFLLCQTIMLYLQVFLNKQRVLMFINQQFFLKYLSNDLETFIVQFYRLVDDIVLLMHLHILRFYFVKLFFLKDLLFQNILQKLVSPSNKTQFKVSFRAKNRKLTKCRILHSYFVGQKYTYSKINLKNPFFAYYQRKNNLVNFHLISVEQDKNRDHFKEFLF